MMFYLWPKYTGLVQKAVAEFMKRNGAGETPKETLKDLPQRLLVRRPLSMEGHANDDYWHPTRRARTGSVRMAQFLHD